MQKILLMGLGQVGTSLLKMIVDEDITSKDNILVLDKDASVVSKLSQFGISTDNFIEKFIGSSNYTEILDYAEPKSIVIDLVNGVDNYLIAKMCNDNDIHYISTCDDCFDGKFDCYTFDTHYKMYKELKENCKKATSVLQIGMNPGMVNIFSKKALIDIVNNDKGAFVTEHKDELLTYIQEKKFNKLAQMLDVVEFSETDLDVTNTNIVEDVNTCYSTWNVPDYDIEINEKTIIKMGTNDNLATICEKFNVGIEDVFNYSKETGTLILDKTAVNVKRDVFTPIQDNVSCATVSHEEVFSLHDYYTVRDEDGNIVYAPTVSFSYMPCPLAWKSIVDHKDNVNERLITKDTMIEGGEVVGMIVRGNNFTTRYVGNYLDYKDTGFETPTIMQVSIACLSAIKYIMNHTDFGVIFAEETDVDEMIQYSLPYYKIITSVELDK